MTSTAHFPHSPEAPRPTRRSEQRDRRAERPVAGPDRAAARARIRRAEDPATTRIPHVPPSGPGSANEFAATARELQELRQQMAELRADYARIRNQMQGPGTHTEALPQVPPSAERVAERTVGIDQTRPMPLVKPGRSTGPGPAPAAGTGTGRSSAPIPAPTSTPMPATQALPRVASAPRPPTPRPPTPRPTPTPARRQPAPRVGPAPRSLTPRTTPVVAPRRAPGPSPRGLAPRATPASTPQVIRTSPPAALRPGATPAPAVRPMPAPGRTAAPVGGAPATIRLPVVAPARRAAPAGGLAGDLASVLAEVLKVPTISVDSHFFDDLGADSLLMAQFCARLRQRPDLPSVSIRDIYRHPTLTALAGALVPTAPAPDRPGSTEPSVRPAAVAGLAGDLAAVLAEVLKVPTVRTDGHFFDDLGADSLLMAQFCARLRQRPDLPSVSIKDIYRHTTIIGLAGALAPRAEPSAARPAPARTTPAQPTLPDPAQAPMSRSRPHYRLCGLLQLLLFLGSSVLGMFVMVQGLLWISTSPTLLDTYLRSLMFTSATFTATCLLSILAKWILIGRWKPRQIPVWSLDYVRFWLVKSLIRTNPLVRFAGTPLYSLYLRALGAKIGRGVAIFSPSVPVCTDLITVGSNTLIRKDSVLTGYRAMDGIIQIGPVTLGRDVYVGEMTVLDIGTAMGDGAQLGHSSSLHTGQAVPAGERWHGSPAEPTTVDYRMVRTTRLNILQRIVLPALQLALLIGVTMPVGLGGMTFLFMQVPQLATLVADHPPVVTTWTFYRDAMLLSTVLFFGSMLLGLLVLLIVPRLLRLLVRPDRDYRLYGIRYWAHRTIGRMTNSKFFTRLYGDSSYIVYFLRGIGYDLGRVEQTGSNFGTAVKHDNPFLSSVGRGTVVADGLSFINADYSTTHFRVARVEVGAHNFLGNRIAYPAQGRAGNNCLLATKVMVPLDGKVREGVGLLGSPSFEIPRTVERDQQLDVTDPKELRRKLRAKNRHNTTTILLFLLSRWVLTSVLTVLGLATVDLYSEFGVLVAALAGFVVLPLTTGYFLLLDRMMRPLQAHRPNGCSIYDKAFWRHERYWKVCADSYIQLFSGTPFKGVIWRLLGVRIGRRVFDDGASFTERTFVSIGDHCTLNAGSGVQCHSQEDGAFKSDRTAIGARCTLGVGAFVHYGVTLNARVLLEPDSFLMKGSEVPAGSWWGGNPAMEIGVRPNPYHDLRPAALVGGR